MRYALLVAVVAALVAVIAGVESTVEGGTAAVLRSCSPAVLLATLASLVLSWALSRAAWIRSELASIENAELGTSARLLSGACAGFAFLATISFHWSLQISSIIAVATAVAGVALGAATGRRGPWLAFLAVPAIVIAIEFPSVASAIFAGVFVVGGGTQLNRRNRLMPSAIGACAGSVLAIVIRLSGAHAGVWAAVLAILIAARLLRPDPLIPSAVALAAFAAHAAAGFAGVFVVAFLAGGWLAADWIRRWAPRLEAHGAAIDAIPEDRRGLWIALAACAGLVIELVLIRWQSSSFQLFAYFKNATLFSAFLGLGMGYAMGPARPLLAAFVLPALGLQVVLLHGLRFSGLQPVLQNPIPEQIALGMGLGVSFAQAAVTYGFLLLTFAATALTCVPLGQLAGRLMRRGKPLRAYGWNLAGSLAGVLLFTALAEFWSPPAAWFLVGGALLLPFLVFGRDARLAAPSVVAMAVALVVLMEHRDPAETEVHSPYQVLVLRRQPTGPPTLTVNNVYFQNVLDLRPESVRTSEKLRGAAAHYELPYQLKKVPGNVLVVGSGTGNDVAAALRLGAAKVDAVEIDPAILKFGALHPERPYSDPRVRAITEDARQHLKRTGERYGLVVYGLLDSHTLLSGRSNVRLDSFVYTVEGLRDARARLAPDGVVALAFCVLTDEIARKLYLMMREAFDGAPPRVFRTTYDEGMVFAAGPGLRSDVRPPEGVVDVTDRVAGLAVRADVSTDDWPFLYMGRRQYPKSYLVMAAGILGLSALLVRRVLPGSRILGAPSFFLLGAGFMLIESKAITQAALVFGSTWRVTSAVIAAVLVMAFVSNAIVARWGKVNSGPAYLLLGLAIAAGMLVPVGAFAGLPPIAAQALAAALVTLPVLFSGFVFSAELNRTADLPGALASNLVGAMAGGLIEYNSMYFGFNALGFAALALYAAAWASSRRQDPSPAPA